MRYLMILFVLLLTLTSCAGVQQYPTGLPATSADKFYFHMKQEASDRGYTSNLSTEGDALSIDVVDAWLQYGIWQDEIMLAITIKGATNLTDEEIASGQEHFKKLSDEMVAAARKRAQDANAFE